jgi:hypothetical protein
MMRVGHPGIVAWNMGFAAAFIRKSLQSLEQSMTQQSGRNDYGQNQNQEGTVGQMAEKARELGQEALDRADEWVKPVGLSVKERPMTFLAVLGSIAFAAGALWMMRNSQQQTRMEDLRQQLSDYARRSRFW